MTVLLRFIGVMNAAVWFGGSLFFTFAVAPTFFAPEMTRVFGEAYTGVIAQNALERYFLLQYWCGGIAIMHQLAEWVYLGRTLSRFGLYVLGGVLCLGMAGGLWLQPKMQKWHRVVYSAKFNPGQTLAYSAAEQERARKAFRRSHWIAQSINGLALLGLAFYTWRVMNPPDPTRYLAPTKFPGAR